MFSKVTNRIFSVKMDYTKFLHGTSLRFSQINAMISKKYLYSIRNYILLFIQFFIPAFFIVTTMLTDSLFSGNKDLPELAISLVQYLTTVTTIEKGTLPSDSISEKIFTNYESYVKGLSNEHTLYIATKNFEDAILDKYGESLSRTNLNYMVGVTIDEFNITAWFNNQAYHTAPLAVNLINNAMLKGISGNAARQMNLINKPLPFTTESRVSLHFRAFQAFFLMSFFILSFHNSVLVTILDSILPLTLVSEWPSSQQCSSFSTSRNVSVEPSFFSSSAVSTKLFSGSRPLPSITLFSS